MATEQGDRGVDQRTAAAVEAVQETLRIEEDAQLGPDAVAQLLRGARTVGQLAIAQVGGPARTADAGTRTKNIG